MEINELNLGLERTLTKQFIQNSLTSELKQERRENRLLAEIIRLKNAENQIDTSDKNLSEKIKDLEIRRKEIQENIDHLQKNLGSKK